MPFSKILHVFQTISQVALLILPISNRRPLLISPESNSGLKHRSLCWMPSNIGTLYRFYAQGNYRLCKFYAQRIFLSYQFYAQYIFCLETFRG